MGIYQFFAKKVGAKVTALARMVKIIPFEKKKLLMRVFIESQFSYCPLLWMFCSRKISRRINYIHERALRLVYDDYMSSCEDLLRKDSTVSIHHYFIFYLQIIVQHQQSDDFDNEPCSLDFFMSIIRCSSKIL